MKKIKNLTKRIFNAKRVGTLAMLLFCGVAATLSLIHISEPTRH